MTDAAGTIYSVAVTDQWLLGATGGNLNFGEVWSLDFSGDTLVTDHETSLDDVPARGRGAGMNDQWAAIGSEDGSITVYQTGTWTDPEIVLDDPADSVWSVEIITNYLIAGTWRDGIYVYELPSFELDQHIDDVNVGSSIVYKVTVSASENYLVAATSDDESVVYDIGEGWEFVATLGDPQHNARGASFSPDDIYVAVGSQDTDGYIYDSPIEKSPLFVSIRPQLADAAIPPPQPLIQSTAKHTERAPFISAATGTSPPTISTVKQVAVAPSSATTETAHGSDLEAEITSWGIWVVRPSGVETTTTAHTATVLAPITVTETPGVHSQPITPAVPTIGVENNAIIEPIPAWADAGAPRVIPFAHSEPFHVTNLTGTAQLTRDVEYVFAPRTFFVGDGETSATTSKGLTRSTSTQTGERYHDELVGELLLNDDKDDEDSD